MGRQENPALGVYAVVSEESGSIDMNHFFVKPAGNKRNILFHFLAYPSRYPGKVIPLSCSFEDYSTPGL